MKSDMAGLAALFYIKENKSWPIDTTFNGRTQRAKPKPILSKKRQKNKRKAKLQRMARRVQRQ